MNVFLSLAILLVPTVLFIRDLINGRFKGDTKIVCVDDETFEFRFWEDEDNCLWAGVYLIDTPRKIFGKEFPRYIEIDEGWGMNDRVKWCWNVVAKRQRCQKWREEESDRVKKFLEGE